MVASSRITLDIKAIESQKQSIDQIQLLVIEVADEAIDQANDRNLPLIRQYPPTLAVHPFEFASDKSRRYYFAVIVPKLGNTGRYQRTGGLAKSWNVVRTKGRGAYRAELSSSKDWTLFVVGNLNKGRQVPGHRNTGWQFVAPKIESWQSDVLSIFFIIYSDRVGDLSGVKIR